MARYALAVILVGDFQENVRSGGQRFSQRRTPYQ